MAEQRDDQFPGGIFPAMLTPMTPDEEIDAGAFEALVDFLFKRGVDGLFVCGSTGEGLLLSLEERQRVAEWAVEHSRGRGRVMVHVGALASRDAAALARHAQRIGADAISALAPFFFDVDEATVLHHYRTITADCELPFFGYYIPQRTSVSLDLDFLARLADIPTFAGLKYSDASLYPVERLIDRVGDRLTILYGRDEQLVSGLATGVSGGIGTTYNLMPEKYVGIFEAMKKGDLAAARGIQTEANRITQVLHKYGPIPATKAAMEFLGVDCGPVRAPLVALSAEQRRGLEKDLKEAGFGV